MPLNAPPPPSKSALRDAHRLGRETGSKMRKLGIDCPYGFDTILLRQQWFAGFSEGRGVLRLALIEE